MSYVLSGLISVTSFPRVLIQSAQSKRPALPSSERSKPRRFAYVLARPEGTSLACIAHKSSEICKRCRLRQQNPAAASLWRGLFQLRGRAVAQRAKVCDFTDCTPGCGCHCGQREPQPVFFSAEIACFWYDLVP